MPRSRMSSDPTRRHRIGLSPWTRAQRRAARRRYLDLARVFWPRVERREHRHWDFLSANRQQQNFGLRSTTQHAGRGPDRRFEQLAVLSLVDSRRRWRRASEDLYVVWAGAEKSGLPVVACSTSEQQHDLQAGKELKEALCVRFGKSDFPRLRIAADDRKWASVPAETQRTIDPALREGPEEVLGTQVVVVDERNRGPVRFGFASASGALSISRTSASTPPNSGSLYGRFGAFICDEISSTRLFTGAMWAFRISELPLTSSRIDVGSWPASTQRVGRELVEVGVSLSTCQISSSAARIVVPVEGSDPDNPRISTIYY